jgi:hypothetical protein
MKTPSLNTNCPILFQYPIFQKLSMVLKIIAIKDFKEAKLPSLDKALQVQSRIRKLFLFQPLNLMKLYISLKIYISFYVH